MSALRQITHVLLLIALLPWGAYLGTLAVPPASQPAWSTDLSAKAETSVRPAPEQALQKPVVKCRQGLPGFRCNADPGTLVQVARAELGPRRGWLRALGTIQLPKGQSPGPRLRPPISA